MATLLLDSCVLVKWFTDESDSDRALEILAQSLDGRLMLAYANLSLFEFANALLFKRQFTADEITEALAALQALDMLRLDFSPKALDRSVELSMQYDIAIYDGYLVAVAEQNQMVLLTADQKLIRRCFAHKSVADLTIHKLPSEEQ